MGTEIKSIREGKASIADTYCTFNNGELWVKQMHIALYRFGSFSNHEVKRDRKLLLTKRELGRLRRQSQDVGKTIIPTDLFISESGLAKLRIALCKGKHSYDKRQTLREREDKRSIELVYKNVFLK